MKDNSPTISVSSNFLPEISQFWNQLIPNICSDINDTSYFKSKPPKEPPVKLVIRYVDLPNEPSSSTSQSAETKQSTNSTVSSNSWDKLILILTIVIGSCLLIFNIAIFVGIFLQTRKIRLMKISCHQQKSVNSIGDINRNIYMNNNNNNHAPFGPSESIPLAVKTNSNSNYDFLEKFH